MSNKFNEQFNFTDGDGFYEALIHAHRDLTQEDSHRLNARLVLLLANQVGDMAVLDGILEAARDNLKSRQPEHRTTDFPQETP